MSEIPAGWYPSPEVEGQLQYWDGQGWTNYRAVASDDPSTQATQATQAAEPVAAQPVQQAQAAPAQAVTVDPGLASTAGIGAVGGAGAAAAGSPATVVPAQEESSGKKRFSLGGRGIQAPGAVVATSAEEAEKALKRARLISFATGLVLFIFGVIIGALIF